MVILIEKGKIKSIARRVMSSHILGVWIPDYMESNEIITKVTEPTGWVNPIVTVQKPSDALRICLDPLELNKSIRREHYSIPTPGEIVAKLHGAQYFSTLNATSGFLQIPLDNASSYVTTHSLRHRGVTDICVYHSESNQHRNCSIERL